MVNVNLALLILMVLMGHVHATTAIRKTILTDNANHVHRTLTGRTDRAYVMMDTLRIIQIISVRKNRWLIQLDR